ncbi:MAG: hypothetical protein CFE26_10235 [Verrucomicrobiales bacterium VVV1]|nr:MAG: hypothetical protein CFE26_10235 [Verrucomicrobiales bacterium VVV1]
MKNLFLIASLLVVTFGLSSCCSMFSGKTNARYRTERVRACGYDTVTREVPVAGSKGGLTETVTTKVPRYKTVKSRVWFCEPCTRYYCPDKDCCGTTGPGTRKMATAQGGVGSPNIGLIPTMKPLAP